MNVWLNQTEPAVDWRVSFSASASSRDLLEPPLGNFQTPPPPAPARPIRHTEGGERTRFDSVIIIKAPGLRASTGASFPKIKPFKIASNIIFYIRSFTARDETAPGVFSEWLEEKRKKETVTQRHDNIRGNRWLSVLWGYDGVQEVVQSETLSF